MFEKGYDKATHQNEIKTAEWLRNTFGGKIFLQKENTQGDNRADYSWDGKQWELKNPTTEEAANSAIRKGLLQICNNRESEPGGIILDYGSHRVSVDGVKAVIDKRLQWRTDRRPIDIIVVTNTDVMIWRHK